MLSFTNPVRWRIWPWLWKFITDLLKIKAISEGESKNDIGVCNAIEQPDGQKIVLVKPPPQCLSVGFSGFICKADEDTVVKHPKYIPGKDSYNRMFRDMIDNERHIYERLGSHQGIISYLGIHDESTGAIRLAYAKQGDLERYIQANAKPSEAIRGAWIQSLVETFWYIYSRKVLHQDVKPNNILVQNDSLKVADFANAEMYALDADMEVICERDPLSRVDILGLGCIIYSIAAWQVFYYDYFENNIWPEPAGLPPTSGLLFGDIIDKCWRDSYRTMKPLYEDFRKVHEERG
ncbi:hypothetical protein VTN31DRAFT_4914 [Thermomyces dupontii]|uniref:uncharacterized protein n=1 Tax=Talaromyces thermophilus TaxID=28565 RepID=UPI00374349E9